MRSDTHSFSAGDIAPLERALGIGGRPSARAVGTLVAIAGALGLLAFIGEGGFLAGVLASVTLVIAGLAWASSAFSRRTLQNWIERHSDCAPIVTWDDTGFGSGGCAHHEDATFAWRAIRSAIISPEYMILQTRCGPLIVPRRALGEAQTRDLQDRFDAHAIPVRLIGD